MSTFFRHHRFYVLLILLICPLSSCTSSSISPRNEVGGNLPAKNQEAKVKKSAQNHQIRASQTQSSSQRTSSNHTRSEERPTLPSKNLNSLTDDLPAMAMIEVNKWIEFYQRHPKTLNKHLAQGSQYKSSIEEIFEKTNMPKDLYYVAIIESGFNIHAKSPVHALGVWQFMKETGSRYGLKSNWYQDDRLDPLRATEAAGLYLRDLHNVFQSWYLALAAYNAGEVRVLSAIMRGNTRNIWELINRKLLPRETRNYIPKFIASALIGKNPEKYGFSVEPIEPLRMTKLEVPSKITLAKASKITNVSASTLKQLNPHLKKNRTPPTESGMYALWVPKPSGDLLSLGEANDIKPSAFASIFYQVSNGDTLGNIARRHQTSIEVLRELNNLKGSLIVPGQVLQVADATLIQNIYTVKKGENLNHISKRFGVSVKRLKKLNSIHGETLSEGQKIVINPVQPTT